MGSLFINEDLPHHTAVTGHLTQPTRADPYRYQHGFNNHHSSEAFAGALPRNGTNLPQQHPYGLYAEHLNGTPFVSSRDDVSNVYVTTPGGEGGGGGSGAGVIVVPLCGVCVCFRCT